MTKEDEFQSKRHNNQPCIGPADACLEATLKNDQVREYIHIYIYILLDTMLQIVSENSTHESEC